MESFYKKVLDLSFVAQVIVILAYLYPLPHLPPLALTALPAAVTAFVVIMDLAYDARPQARFVILFVLNYGTYLVVGYVLTSQFYEQARLEQIRHQFQATMVEKPTVGCALFAASLLCADYFSWLVHYVFHKAHARWSSVFFFTHLVHHSMTEMRLLGVRHNALGVFTALVPTWIALTLLGSNPNGEAATAFMGLIAQLALNAILTPFQHCEFTTVLARKLKLAIGSFHAAHHDDARGGGAYHYSVGVFSFWDDLMGTAMPTSQTVYPEYGRLGVRYSGQRKSGLQAYLEAQLRPLKDYLNRIRS